MGPQELNPALSASCSTLHVVSTTCQFLSFHTFASAVFARLVSCLVTQSLSKCFFVIRVVSYVCSVALPLVFLVILAEETRDPFSVLSKQAKGLHS